jgi:hypothetical protein
MQNPRCPARAYSSVGLHFSANKPIIFPPRASKGRRRRRQQGNATPRQQKHHLGPTRVLCLER